MVVSWWFDGDFMVVDSGFMVVDGGFMVVDGGWWSCSYWNRFTLLLDNPAFLFTDMTGAKVWDAPIDRGVSTTDHDSIRNDI